MTLKVGFYWLSGYIKDFYVLGIRFRAKSKQVLTVPAVMCYRDQILTRANGTVPAVMC